MLTNRLETVKNLVEKSDTVFDVGTDHGYVPISLIKEKRANRVIAADINIGPLDNAKKNIRLAGLSEKIELRLGSGICPMQKDEADTVIIAGMGGILISEILNESYEKAQCVNKFILQPMYSQDYLRKYLINNGFKIVKEILSKENEKIYNILVVTPGKEEKNYDNESFLILGHPDNHNKDDIYNYYIKLRTKQALNVLDKLNNAKSDKEEDKNRLKTFLLDVEKYYE